MVLTMLMPLWSCVHVYVYDGEYIDLLYPLIYKGLRAFYFKCWKQQKYNSCCLFWIFDKKQVSVNKRIVSVNKGIMSVNKRIVSVNKGIMSVTLFNICKNHCFSMDWTMFILAFCTCWSNGFMKIIIVIIIYLWYLPVGSIAPFIITELITSCLFILCWVLYP